MPPISHAATGILFSSCASCIISPLTLVEDVFCWIMAARAGYICLLLLSASWRQCNVVLKSGLGLTTRAAPKSASPPAFSEAALRTNLFPDFLSEILFTRRPNSCFNKHWRSLMSPHDSSCGLLCTVTGVIGLSLVLLLTVTASWELVFFCCWKKITTQNKLQCLLSHQQLQSHSVIFMWLMLSLITYHHSWVVVVVGCMFVLLWTLCADVITAAV